MEQKKLEFRDILSECINNPDGEIARTELDKDSQAMLIEANEVMDLIEKNWISLQEAHRKGLNTSEWFDEAEEKLTKE